MKNSSVEVTQKHLLLGNAMSWSFLLATITCTNMFTNKDVIKQLELIDRTSLLLIKKPQKTLESKQQTSKTDTCKTTSSRLGILINIQFPLFFPHGWSMGTIIGSARQILESLLSKTLERNSTHYILATSMAEISVIITTKPLVSVSTDAATPLILTPGSITHNEDTICDVARNLKEFTDKEFYNTK